MTAKVIELNKAKAVKEPSKARLIALVVGQFILKKLRMMFFKQKTFVGKYVDICIERRKFMNENEIYIMADNYTKLSGRKVQEQTLFYVERNAITKFLGFRYTEAHLRNMM